jgi:hypothetical protein
MMMVRTPRYWEQVRDEMARLITDLIDDDNPEDVDGLIEWNEVRKEAIMRLYIRGIFQEIT